MDTLIEPLYIKFILHTIYIYIYIYYYNNGLFKRERDNKRNQREEVEVVVKRAFQDQGERKRDNERGVERGSEGGYEIERKLNNGYVLNLKKKKKKGYQYTRKIWRRIQRSQVFDMAVVRLRL